MIIKMLFVQSKTISRSTKKDSVIRPLGDQRGVSLVELLLALGLTGLTIMLVLMIYFSGFKAWRRIENQMEIQQNLRIAMNILSTEIRKSDTFEIEADGRGISLTYRYSPGKVYRLHEASNEVRMYPSGTTVGRYIKDCNFSYDNGLIEVKIMPQTIEGVTERTYTFSIKSRGKDRDG